jgi:hypothetical protein
VTSGDVGIDCPNVCQVEVADDERLTLEASHEEGSYFTGWGIDGCGEDLSCEILVEGDLVVTPRFEPAARLTVALEGPEGARGEVHVEPVDDRCTSVCDHLLPVGSLVTMAAQGVDLATFEGWQAEVCEGTEVCEFELDQDRLVVALFRPAVTLSVEVEGPGIVRSRPAGIRCPADCSASFAAESSVSLVAEASDQAYLHGWSGDCTGTGSCNVKLDQAHAVGATFHRHPTVTGPRRPPLVEDERQDGVSGSRSSRGRPQGSPGDG